jgi:hypothetical protein
MRSVHGPDLQAALPKEQDWDVWIEWFEHRVRGESLGEAPVRRYKRGVTPRVTFALG